MIIYDIVHPRYETFFLSIHKKLCVFFPRVDRIIKTNGPLKTSISSDF